MTITLPKKIGVGDGMYVTYKGTPNTCSYWELVQVQGTLETTGLGSLAKALIVTDSNGFAVNQYFAPASALDAGKTERIKVREGA